MNPEEEAPTPQGELALQTVAMPADTNPNGDIFAGWLMAQMDLGGSILAKRCALGPVTTVAVGDMAFLRPVIVGSTISCYAKILGVGRSSIRILVDVWISPEDDNAQYKVTEGEFIYVAIDRRGNTRAVPNPDDECY